MEGADEHEDYRVWLEFVTKIAQIWKDLLKKYGWNESSTLSRQNFLTRSGHSNQDEKFSQVGLVVEDGSQYWESHSQKKENWVNVVDCVLWQEILRIMEQAKEVFGIEKIGNLFAEVIELFPYDESLQKKLNLQLFEELHKQNRLWEHAAGSCNQDCATFETKKFDFLAMGHKPANRCEFCAKRIWSKKAVQFDNIVFRVKENYDKVNFFWKKIKLD